MEVARLERGCTCIISLTGVPLWPVAWFAGHSRGIYTRVSHINHVARLGERTGPDRDPHCPRSVRLAVFLPRTPDSYSAELSPLV